jgi:hypothetical protein
MQSGIRGFDDVHTEIGFIVLSIQKLLRYIPT